MISDVRVTTPIDELKEMTKDRRSVTNISGTNHDQQPIASTSTQYWVIPNDIDTQSGPPPLLPITNNLVIPENTYLVYTESGMPVLLNSMPDLNSPIKYLTSVPFSSASKQSAFAQLAIPSSSLMTDTVQEQLPTSVPIITTTSVVPQLTNINQGASSSKKKAVEKVI